MTVREKLNSIGVDWSRWKVRTGDSDISPAERWLDHWKFIGEINTASLPPEPLSPLTRYIRIEEPGFIGIKLTLLVGIIDRKE